LKPDSLLSHILVRRGLGRFLCIEALEDELVKCRRMIARHRKVLKDAFHRSDGIRDKEKLLSCAFICGERCLFYNKPKP
jgi:hypothetical protein